MLRNAALSPPQRDSFQRDRDRETPALRRAEMRAILMFHNCEGQSQKASVHRPQLLKRDVIICLLYVIQTPLCIHTSELCEKYAIVKMI